VIRSSLLVCAGFGLPWPKLLSWVPVLPTFEPPMEHPPLVLNVPPHCEVVELIYRLTRPSSTHLDMTIVSDGEERVLRFRGPRVVQFEKDLPDVLRGLEVKDIRDQNLAGLDLWISVAGGAVTFWAKAMVEIGRRSLDADPQVPVFDAKLVQPWEMYGVPVESFSYRSPARASALRVFSITTRPFGGN
jgi:hypothetical protein